MNQKKQFEGEIDLIDYIKVIYRWRWFVLAIVIIGMLYGGIVETRRPVMFEASVTFFPLDSNFDMKLEGLVVKTKANLKDLVISLLNSRKMSDRIIEQLDLKKIWGTSTVVAAQGALAGVTEITVEQNGLIRLFVRTTSPELSAKIANAYIDNLDYFNQQLNIGAQRNIVQVIDRATVPDEGTPRRTMKKSLMTGIIAFVFAVFLAVIVDFAQKSGLLKRLKE